jgi:hypothetical protein
MAFKRSLSVPFFFISHPHITNTLHPERFSARMLLASRLRFFCILALQKLTLDPTGLVASLHRRQPCQKHPCTNMHIRREGNTMSGLPLSVRSCSRYLSPPACRNRRTIISGAVFLPRTWDMMRLRTWGSTVSMQVANDPVYLFLDRTCLWRTAFDRFLVAVYD